MKGLPYKWLVAIVVIFGVFMVLLDTTIVNIAIPRLQTAFGAGLTDVDWVASGYTLAEGIGIPLTPYFSGLLGNKRFYLIILVLFTIGSALCGLAWSLTALIVFRILQGLAGAAMLPMSITLLYSEFPPEERGIALGALGFPLLLAPALGPSVGGYIVTFVDWRVLFYINVPIGILGFFMASAFLRDTRPEGGRSTSFDFAGFLFSSIGLGSLIYALDKAGADGWGSLTVLGFMLTGFSSLATFVIVEFWTINRGKQPLLDLRLFRFRSFTGGSIAMMTVIFALFGGQFLVPLYLQDLRGLSAYAAGLVLLPQAIGSMVASLIGGRLVDKLGVKAVVLPGLVILATALWGFSQLTLQTLFTTFQIFLIMRGLGLGLSMQPTNVAALSEMKSAQLAQASSLISVVRSVTSALAVATVATFVTAQTSFHSARLAEQVTPGSMAGQALQQKAAYLASQGMTPQNAMIASMQVTVQQLGQQAYLLAMNDTFLITLAVTFFTMLVVIFVVRSPRKKAAIAAASEKQGKVVSGGELAEHAKGSSVSTLSSSMTVPPDKRAAIQKRRKETPMKRFMNRSVLIPTALILATIIIIGVVGDLLYNNYNFYSTDDAQVSGQIVNIITPVSGTLINLNVQVGDEVSAQQIIGTIQPSGYQPVQHLIAPEDGVVVQVLGVVGELVGTQTPIVQETDPSTVYVTAYVDESSISSIAVGQAVDIHVDAYNTTVPGHVTQIVGAAASQFSLLPTTDNSSGNYTKVGQRIPVYVQLATPPDGSLLPGMSVEVKIHLH